MIKVIYKNILDGSTQQSDFASTGAFESHKELYPELYSELYSVVAEDVTEKAEEKKNIASRASKRKMCLEIIDYIATYNEKQVGDIKPLFANPQMLPVIMALLTGAPKTAADMLGAIDIQEYPLELVGLIREKLYSIAAG